MVTSVKWQGMGNVEYRNGTHFPLSLIYLSILLPVHLLVLPRDCLYEILSGKEFEVLSNCKINADPSSNITKMKMKIIVNISSISRIWLTR